jgi:hypothetical protein
MHAAEDLNPCSLVRETIAALGSLDTAALLRLELQAASIRPDALTTANLREFTALHSTLEDLLRSTGLSLNTLQTFHQASTHAAREASWER